MIFIFAFSSLGILVNLPKPVYSLITHRFGIGKLDGLHKNQASWMLCCYGALISIVSFSVKAVVCVASLLKDVYYKKHTLMLIQIVCIDVQQITGILSLVVKRAKSKRRKHHLSVLDLCTYIHDEALALVGKGRQKWPVHPKNNVRDIVMLPVPFCRCFFLNNVFVYLRHY